MCVAPASSAPWSARRAWACAALLQRAQQALHGARLHQRPARAQRRRARARAHCARRRRCAAALPHPTAHASAVTSSCGRRWRAPPAPRPRACPASHAMLPNATATEPMPCTGTPPCVVPCAMTARTTPPSNAPPAPVAKSRGMAPCESLMAQGAPSVYCNRTRSAPAHTALLEACACSTRQGWLQPRRGRGRGRGRSAARLAAAVGRSATASSGACKTQVAQRVQDQAKQALKLCLCLRLGSLATLLQRSKTSTSSTQDRLLATLSTLSTLGLGVGFGPTSLWARCRACLPYAPRAWAGSADCERAQKRLSAPTPGAVHRRRRHRDRDAGV